MSLSPPGPWIDMTDRDLAFTIDHLIHMAIDQFNEAVLACELFSPLHVQWISELKDESHTLQKSKDSTLLRLYAKSFICSVDATRSFLFVLASQHGLPVSTKEACRKFQQDFGYLRDIRNSIQHIEERAQGLGRNNQPLNVRLLVLGAFIDNRFGITTDNGCYVDVEISEATLQLIRLALQKIIWSVKWLGPGSIAIETPEIGSV